MKRPTRFTAAELATLREHGFVVFADRVIFDAQPPRSDAAIAAIERQCAGPLPAPLVELWRTTAGGALAYDLSVRFGDRVEALSWTELFHDGGDGAMGLQAWIDHELARTPGTKRGKKLLALPIGGFDTEERIYVFVGPGAAHGAVFAWSEGPPPDWTRPGEGESVARIADNLPGAFAALTLDEPPGPDHTFVGHVGDQVEAGLGRALARKLLAFHAGVVSDWKALRTSKAVAKDPGLGLRALSVAIKRDDAAAIRQLAGQVPLDRPVAGPSLPLELATSLGRFAAANALLEAGAPFGADGLTYLDEHAPPELVQALLERGAEPLIVAIVNCARAGNRATADLLARAYAARHDDLARAFARAHAAELKQQRTDLRQSKAGRFLHHAGEEAIERNIANLEAYQLPGPSSPAPRSRRR